MIFYRNTIITVILLILVNCEYSDWGEWAECDKACGGGSQLRTREAKRQAWYGGTKCTEEDSKQTQVCNEQACPGNLNNGHHY